ncbi:MAG: hypothetical protein ACREFW_06010 [Rhizomicrobium sp.]
MSAIGLPHGKDFIISASADYRHDTLVFARMQSQALRELEWENRLKPLKSWSALLARFAIGAALLAAILAFVL